MMESPKRKLQKQNDYQRHKLFRKIKRRRKALAELEQEVATKLLKKKLKLPKYNTGTDDVIMVPRSEIGVDLEGNVLRNGLPVGDGTLRLQDVDVRPRNPFDIDIAERNAEMRLLRSEMGDAAYEEYMNKLKTLHDIHMASIPQGESIYGYAADAIDGLMTGVSMLPGPVSLAGDEYWALRGANQLSQGDPLGVLGFAPMIGKAIPEIKNVAKSIYFSDNSNALYLRYIGGKLKYGFDAKIPDLYRRYVTLPDMSGKYTTLSPVNSRFAYETGDASPLITNFTTDYPVLPNSGGDWSLRPILKIPGKTLLGKKVISTRPSDTFVFGENIKVPTKNILIFDKNTSQELYEAFLKALNNAEGVRKGRFVLDKPRDYGLEFEQALLKAATDGWRPRLKDYLFMDYVLRPKYLSLVYNADILSSKNLPDDILNAMSNALSRSLLFDGHYKNVVYDPSSPVESEFRKNKGIILRSKIPINKRNFNFGKDVRVKQCKKNNIIWV